MQESSVVAGIDWAAELHAVCLLGADGKVLERFDVTHDSQTLHVMVSRFCKAGVTKVAIERGNGPVTEGIGQCGARDVRCRRHDRSKPYGPVTDRQGTKMTAGAHASSLQTLRECVWRGVAPLSERVDLRRRAQLGSRREKHRRVSKRDVGPILGEAEFDS